MNRDEKRDRVASLPPEIVELESRHAIFPREPTGGTWISVNDGAVCLALINWYKIQRKPNNGILSRGLVVRELAGQTSTDKIATSIKRLPLRKLRPFRLIAIVPGERRVIEWRWNLQRLAIRNHEWRRRHWFSSGFDEHTAERVRTKICASFAAGSGLSAVALAKADDSGKSETSRRDRSAGVNAAGSNLRLLRQLHRSHAPKRGPFSICMHRPDAETVSYAEVIVSKQRATMRYKSGAACFNGSKVTRMISLARSL